MNTEEIKKRLGEKAVSFVKEGMTVGLGTGSSAKCFIDSLAKEVKNGLNIRAVSSSKRSFEQAKNLGIPVFPLEEVDLVDLTIDGADEVDPHKNLIKGAGGAHIREKVLASFSKSFLVIVDNTKLVKNLGDKKPLPVEIVAFGKNATKDLIEKLSLQGDFRKTSDGALFVTDNGGYLIDLDVKGKDLDTVHKNLLAIPGVVDTGYFKNLANGVLVGYEDGRISLLD